MEKPDLETHSDPAVIELLVKKQGFAVIALPDRPLDEMRSRLGELAIEDMKTWDGHPQYRDHWMVMNLMFRDSIFSDFIEAEDLQNYISPILGASFILYSFTSSSMPPSGTNFSRRVHNDAPRFIPGYPTNVGLVVPLDDFTTKNGATLVLPFSHKQEEKPTDKEFESNAIEVLAKRGTGLLFNARLWHSGGENRSSEPRNALTLNFCRSFMRQHFDFSRMAEDLDISQFGKNARKLIGMNVRIPASLSEYYVPDAMRKYQPNQG